MIEYFDISKTTCGIDLFDLRQLDISYRHN
jgi:hypothetical protein